MDLRKAASSLCMLDGDRKRFKTMPVNRICYRNSSYRSGAGGRCLCHGSILFAYFLLWTYLHSEFRSQFRSILNALRNDPVATPTRSGSDSGATSFSRNSAHHHSDRACGCYCAFLVHLEEGRIFSLAVALECGSSRQPGAFVCVGIRRVEGASAAAVASATTLSPFLSAFLSAAGLTWVGNLRDTARSRASWSVAANIKCWQS